MPLTELNEKNGLPNWLGLRAGFGLFWLDWIASSVMGMMNYFCYHLWSSPMFLGYDLISLWVFQAWWHLSKLVWKFLLLSIDSEDYIVSLAVRELLMRIRNSIVSKNPPPFLLSLALGNGFLWALLIFLYFFRPLWCSGLGPLGAFFVGFLPTWVCFVILFSYQ